MSDSTSGDDRASGGARAGRPAYGEYATPEEQAKARGPVAPAGPPPAPDAAGRDATSQDAVPTWTVPAWSAASSGRAQDGATAAERPGPPAPRTADRIVTVVLLSLGLLNVLWGIPGFLSLASTLQAAYDQMGVGQYGAGELAGTLGVVAVVSQLLIWAATAWGSVRRMRRGRLSWWVPLVGAAVAFIVVMLVFTIAIVSDPAFTAYVESQVARG